MPRRSLALLGLLPAFIAGCGGSDHHSSSPSSHLVGPRVTIAWPARARAFGAPAAATAARITFPTSGVDGVDLADTVLRPNDSAAATKGYTLAIGVQPGSHVVRVDFLADANSAPLATATVNVRVAKDGTVAKIDGSPLGAIGYDSNVASLAIDPGQTVEVGEPADLSVTASTSGGIVALKPGSVRFTVTQGANALQANADGTVTGLAPGTATVTAAVDGVASAATTVTVLPAPIVARTVDLATTDLLADPTRGTLWVALASVGPNSNTVARLDPATGALTTRIAVGGSPNVLALSDDGSTLYAGLKDVGAVQKIDLATGTAGLQFTLPNSGFATPTYPIDIAVQPGHPSTIALTRQDIGDSGYDGPAVFDDGVQRPNARGTYEGSQLVWTAVDRIVGFPAGFSSGSLDELAVDSQGVTLSRTVPTNANLNRRVIVAGGRLYGANGVVTDAATLAPLGTFDLPTGPFGSVYGPAVDLTARRAYYLAVGDSFSDATVELYAFDIDSLARVAVRRVAGLSLSGQGGSLPDVRLTLAGTNRLAFRLDGKVVFLEDVNGL